MSDNQIYDFDDWGDPPAVFPFKKSKSPARSVAWLIFSRLYVHRLNPLMCTAPKGFSDELMNHFKIISTNYGRGMVAFEWTEPLENIQEKHWRDLFDNRKMVTHMIIKSATLYAGTAKSLSADESRILAGALGLDSVSKMLSIKLDDSGV